MLVYSDCTHAVVSYDESDKPVVLSPGWNVINADHWKKWEKQSVMDQYIKNKKIKSQNGLPSTVNALEKILKDTYSKHEIEKMRDIEAKKDKPNQEFFIAMDRRVNYLNEHLKNTVKANKKK